ARKVLQSAIDKIQDKRLSILAKVAFDKNSDINIIIDSKYDGVKAKYSLGNNTIYLGTKHTGEQITHELIHAATAQAIETDPNFFDKVSDIYMTTYSQKDKLSLYGKKLLDKLEGMNEKERLHEFIALGLTNPDFINDLKKVDNLGKRVWNKIVEVFAKLPNIPTKEFDALKIGIKILE
ncbi:MAG: hypothetical protein LGB66_04495, partial [Sulfurovum sp.]|nr:hypothetical protein [Sulfurovum sp.]